MVKVDFHTHSIASPDGGVTAEQYKKTIESGMLDVIAITDHNTIDFAELLHEQLGDKIIIGEEIMSSAGEIIGLYLTKRVRPGLTPLETVEAIKDQGGIVYIPHPFETFRKGLHPSILDELTDHIDIVEVCNGRALLQNRGPQAVVWTRLNNKVGAAASDAHGFYGLGSTYTELSELPTKDNLLQLLTHATRRTSPPSLRSLLYPKYHRLTRKLRGTS